MLRVVAALGVLFVHVNGMVYLSVFGEIAGYGADGVKCFFTLSGLLVMKSYASRISLKDYWTKRVARTFPLYYFWLLVILITQFTWATTDPFAIVRAIFMLEYIAPPTVSYDYCSMHLLGVMTIFMIFYIAVPFISKYVKSLESAFVGFCATVAILPVLRKLYFLLYSGICDINDLENMVYYILNAVPFFALGVMMYFGIRDNRIWQLMGYLMLLFVATLKYSFLPYSEHVSIGIFLTVLICFPFKLDKISKVVKWRDKYTMGLFITQALCFSFVNKAVTTLGFGKVVQLFLLTITPCICAVLVYHFVEMPGKKLILKLMK